METRAGGQSAGTLRTLPGDEARQIMWRFAGRYDVQMFVQSVRAVARGPVARLVAQGGRHTHEWTADKHALLEDYDRAGLTTAHLDPSSGGFIDGPKNLALALAAFELSWVDAGAATGSLAHHLALAPIHYCGTPEQRETYVLKGAGGPGRPPLRGAFCLTEPIPYVGVETGLLSGKLRVAEWRDGEEPVLQLDKRGRFITNMGFADFVTVAVDSADPRIKGSCMVVIEATDPGVFDRGVPTRKLVHQLSSTRDPVFSVRVPASRIVGGYSVKDGAIVPRYPHGQIIEAVFGHTRVTVGAMTAAKLLSAVEPILRYQRGRFRGVEAITPGSPRYALGLQQREDALHRLIDVWATGEAAASLGFAAARVVDELDLLEPRKSAALASRGIAGGTAEFRALRALQKDAVEYLAQSAKPEGVRDEERVAALAENALVRFVVLGALSNVLCPATKLWNTGHGATTMREAVSLMGGYGLTEDCPGFLAHKWVDAQLEATYEGPEAVQRRHLALTMTDEVFLSQFRIWIAEMRHLAAHRPGTGACALASAMELWLWTLQHLQRASDPVGDPLYDSGRQGVTFPLADALCWLVASRCQILDVLELEAEGPGHPALEEGLPGLVQFLTDLCHVQAARAAGEVGRIAAELVFGYNRHPAWDEDCAGCYDVDNLDALEAVMPGIGSVAGAITDVIEVDGSHRAKAGPCVRFDGLDEFSRLRRRMDGCLTGCRLAKDRAASALTTVMIPETLDYPV
jgi:alkylation response protein AidB-like acyl-CoA dehydrogenase